MRERRKKLDEKTKKDEKGKEGKMEFGRRGSEEERDKINEKKDKEKSKP